jgi:hypothetical protein
MGEDRENVKVFTDILSYWQFIQDVEYDIRITRSKETYSKNELIAVFRPHASTDAEISV